MDKTSLFCCLLSGLMALSVSATSPVATQAEVSGDISLRGIARLLQKSDIVLAVVIYKTVETTQETIFYARVIQSLSLIHI